MVFVLAGGPALTEVAGANDAFLPADDTTVLVELPEQRGSLWSEIEQLRREKPDDQASAAIAQRYLRLFRLEGDPRLAGYAAAALMPWAEQPTPPPAISLMRAVLHQSQHRFAEAQTELTRLLQRSWRNPQAWLTLASVALVRADYHQARRGCSRLVLLTEATVAGACMASVQIATGEPQRAYDFLSRSATRASMQPQMQVWLQTLAAEAAAALGRPALADRHFRAAIGASRMDGGPDVYLLTTYADQLLDAGRDRDVRALLAAAAPTDGLRLRASLAEKRLNAGVLAADLSVLVRRYATETGALGHAREAAYLYLYLLDEPSKALRFAQSNWSQQKEFIDARLLGEAALMAGAPSAARPMLSWMDEHTVRHHVLEGLARRLSASLP